MQEEEIIIYPWEGWLGLRYAEILCSRLIDCYGEAAPTQNASASVTSLPTIKRESRVWMGFNRDDADDGDTRGTLQSREMLQQ